MADLIRIHIRETAHGALFRAHGADAARIMNEIDDEIEHDAADWAQDQINRLFHASFKLPTGYYESRVHISNSMGGLEIGDGGQAGPVYGPWLEGVGSRNVTTRFKGYHTFRKVTTMLERHIADIGERILRNRTRDF
jgi:hypothetical protein